MIKSLEFNKFYKDFYHHPQTRSQIIKSLKYEKIFYEKIINDLSKKFNKEFGMNEKVLFWDKILGHFIYYHITQSKNLFMSIKKKKRINQKIKIILKKDFYIPKNLSDYRIFFQRSLLGINQLYSIYFQNFKNTIYEKNIKKKIANLKKTFDQSYTLDEKKNYSFSDYFLRFVNIIYRKINHKTFLASGVYWTQKDKILINYIMKGSLLSTKFQFQDKDLKVDYSLRNKLFFCDKKKNKFEFFFYETLKFSAPMSVVENIHNNFKQTRDYTKRFVNLKYFLNENLSESNLFLNAFLHKKKVKSIYIQHNFLSHIYLSNQLDFILKKFDKYYTFGWSIPGNKKIESAGSLFKWLPSDNKIPFDSVNEYILFVPTKPLEVMHYTSGYLGECGKFFVKKYINSEKNFFSNLRTSIKKKIIYKAFPNNQLIDYEDNNFKIIKKNLKKNNIKIFDSKKLDVEKYFLNAKLIIISYLATSYLQALKSNKPTVIFFTEETYFLKKKYSNYFKDLIDAKILHKDAKKVAIFVNSIENNICDWWHNKNTVLARKNFLKKNFKQKEFMYKKLANLMKK